MATPSKAEGPLRTTTQTCFCGSTNCAAKRSCARRVTGSTRTFTRTPWKSFSKLCPHRFAGERVLPNGDELLGDGGVLRHQRRSSSGAVYAELPRDCCSSGSESLISYPPGASGWVIRTIVRNFETVANGMIEDEKRRWLV